MDKSEKTNGHGNGGHPVRLAQDKIKTVNELGVIAEALRKEGKTIALCHGVFDLVHLGHVRHVQAARKEADVLFITVTADAFVNKGPDRPIFPDHMRAEMLAAFEYVDYVGINKAQTSEPVIEAVKPEVYVKGPDYENPDEDVTGKIDVERSRVEGYGGRIVFTRDITFSSSSLINRYMDTYDPPLRGFLHRMREEDALTGLLDLIESVKDYKVVLVGETIIDEYNYVSPLGKPSKENIIATLYENHELFAGGVIAAANHVSNFCREVEVITMLDSDGQYDSVLKSNLNPNVTLKAVRVEGRPTPRKTRFVEQGYVHKLFEVYSMDDDPLEKKYEDKINELIKSSVGDANLVVVTDFGHGMINKSTVEALQENSKFLAVNTQTNAGNRGFNLITKYSKADYICIDAPEARMAAADKHGDVGNIASKVLPDLISCDSVAVTNGKYGSYSFSKRDGLSHIPAFTKTVVDTVGAGDAYFVATAPLVAAGGHMERVNFIGNAVGALKVGIIGHRSSVEKVPLIKFVTTLLK